MSWIQSYPQTAAPASNDKLNAHFPPLLPDSKIINFTTNEWLDVGFFDEAHPSYPSLALSTLFNFLQNPNRFIHAPTNTWRGGPSGVRWIVAVISRIATSLTLIDNGISIPLEIQRVFDASIHQRTWTLLGHMADWLITSLQLSIKTLSQSYSARSKAWKAAVISAHLTGQVEQQEPGTHTSVQATHGVPTDQLQLHQFFQALTQTDPEMTLGEEPTLLARATANRPARQTRFASDDDASSEGEEIVIPDFSSSEGSSSPTSRQLAEIVAAGM
jgi:hypothetical protein